MTRNRTDAEWEAVFADSQAKRDRHCVGKDAIVSKILAGLTINRPSKFKAILMPSLYGPEVGALQARGIPPENIFAIERSPHVHRFYCQPSKGFRRFVGMQTTPRPLPVQQAIDFVSFGPANLIYLDFFSQPDGGHLYALRKIFRLGLCKRGTRLLTTFGVNRGDTFSCRLNRRLRAVSAGQAYIEAALSTTNHCWYRKITNHHYTTQFRSAHFTTTEVAF